MSVGCSGKGGPAQSEMLPGVSWMPQYPWELVFRGKRVLESGSTTLRFLKSV
jgi:hypothetical protein